MAGIHKTIETLKKFCDVSEVETGGRFVEDIEVLDDDFHRRNLMFQQCDDSRQALIAMDWAQCGPGSTRHGLAELVVYNARYMDRN